MRRDLELIRKIILAVEASPHGNAPNPLLIEGYSEEQIGYHSYLIVDAGLAEGYDVGHMGSPGPEWVVLHLTHAGHDFADSARDEKRWAKATGIVKEKVGDATIDVIKDVLSGLIRGGLGI